ENLNFIEPSDIRTISDSNGENSIKTYKQEINNFSFNSDTLRIVPTGSTRILFEIPNHRSTYSILPSTNNELKSRYVINQQNNNLCNQWSLSDKTLSYRTPTVVDWSIQSLEK